MISATVIADSISNQNIRITTFSLRYPRFVHAELMTHRVFSRNASSSRAIPITKCIEEVERDNQRAMPVEWGVNKPGMQAEKILTPQQEHVAKTIWRDAAFAAASFAHKLQALGVHKQVANRVLEPYLHINVVVTATSYDNWFGLRLHRDAQPEIRALAEQMWKARKDSTPKLLQPGEWHLPFVFNAERRKYRLNQLLRISTARCARTSYRSFATGKFSTAEEDLALYEKLIESKPLHASPTEHQATPDTKRFGLFWETKSQWGNFYGWRQFRKTLDGEAVAPLPAGYK